MDMSTQFRIIVVGGGIAGLSAAIALRAPGRQITILEQSRLHSEIGATISLQPNASRIVRDEWLLGETLSVARGQVDRGFQIYDTAGKLVTQVPLESKAEYGADRMLYHRQDLHECLKMAAIDETRQGPPAIIKVSSKVVGCDCDNGTVTLESGEELQADLIIGADGIHSKLRNFVLQKAIQPIPTGLSAYRLVVPSTAMEQHASGFCKNIQPRQPFTSMMVAHQCRLIMGPARNGEIFSFVGLVPDERMHEDPDSKQSWVAKGDLGRMLETFAEFPEWAKEPFKLAKDIGLWQLRDIDPLETWTRGRVILIGDAAHAMLPTQGQGASQSVEDAEALGALFAEVQGVPEKEAVEAILQEVFQCRYGRATTIQHYSRMAAKPATEKTSNKIVMRPDEFMDYNCKYRGARDWQKRSSLSISA